MRYIIVISLILLSDVVAQEHSIMSVPISELDCPSDVWHFKRSANICTIYKGTLGYDGKGYERSYTLSFTYDSLAFSSLITLSIDTLLSYPTALHFIFGRILPGRNDNWYFKNDTAFWTLPGNVERSGKISSFRFEEGILKDIGGNPHNLLDAFLTYDFVQLWFCVGGIRNDNLTTADECGGALITFVEFPFAYERLIGLQKH